MMMRYLLPSESMFLSNETVRSTLVEVFSRGLSALIHSLVKADKNRENRPDGWASMGFCLVVRLGSWPPLGRLT